MTSADLKNTPPRPPGPELGPELTSENLIPGATVFNYLQSHPEFAASFGVLSPDLAGYRSAPTLKDFLDRTHPAPLLNALAEARRQFNQLLVAQEAGGDPFSSIPEIAEEGKGFIPPFSYYLSVVSPQLSQEYGSVGNIIRATVGLVDQEVYLRFNVVGAFNRSFDQLQSDYILPPTLVASASQLVAQVPSLAQAELDQLWQSLGVYFTNPSAPEPTALKEYLSYPRSRVSYHCDFIEGRDIWSESKLTNPYEGLRRSLIDLTCGGSGTSCLDYRDYYSYTAWDYHQFIYPSESLPTPPRGLKVHLNFSPQNPHYFEILSQVMSSELFGGIHSKPPGYKVSFSAASEGSKMIVFYPYAMQPSGVGPELTQANFQTALQLAQRLDLALSPYSVSSSAHKSSDIPVGTSGLVSLRYGKTTRQKVSYPDDWEDDQSRPPRANFPFPEDYDAFLSQASEIGLSVVTSP